MSDGQIFDINCDMGESFGNWRMGDDNALMPQITTANVACGFHAGDPVTMMQTVAAARSHDVVVGAHPGLPDKLGFGRRIMALSADDLRGYLIFQVGALKGFLAAAGVRLNHVKPHGAMFHVLRDPAMAEVAIGAIVDVAPEAAIYWPGPVGREPFSGLAAERGLRVFGEAYPDLDYTDDGSLIVERHKQPTSAEDVFRRVSEIVSQGTLTNRAGVKIPMRVSSFCVHSDGSNAVEVVSAVRQAILSNGGRIGAATGQAKG